MWYAVEQVVDVKEGKNLCVWFQKFLSDALPGVRIRTENLGTSVHILATKGLHNPSASLGSDHMEGITDRALKPNITQHPPWHACTLPSAAAHLLLSAAPRLAGLQAGVAATLTG